MKRLIYPLVFITIVLIFFWKFFIHDLLPIPADTIVGLYHPFRDLYKEQYPSGIPFKNFLITDPVRQQYPWRELAVSILRSGQLPLWNPYSHAGTPLLANLQSAIFYPFNLLFFIFPFSLAWSLLVLIQPLLAGLFLYFYLRHFDLHKEACFLGALTYAFSGFFIAWLEWNTVLHVALWLPLVLLSLEKITYYSNSFLNSKLKTQNSKLQLKTKNLFFWIIVFIFSLTSSFFAGHLQIFFYLFLLVLVYFSTILWRTREKKRLSILLGMSIIAILLITSIQWFPTLEFISLSAREFDQANWQREGWFIPWQHMIQFFAPDFFGNPTTLNYWGVWNYGEMIGYIGILPLIMALFAMVWRKDKKTLFFGMIFFLSLIFATPTWFAKLPYKWQIPLISTSQPTRLLFLTDFSLAILAALGLDYFLQKKGLMVRIMRLLVAVGVVYGVLWVFVVAGKQWFATDEWLINLVVAKRNLILPTGLFLLSATLLVSVDFFRKSTKFQKLALFGGYGLLVLTTFDLLRFGWKFTPFTRQEYLFPSTRLIEFLQKQPGPFRIMATDKRILPPNFSVVYRLQTVDGYDPLYLRDYGELVAAWMREKADISPFSFNRILTPQNYESRIADLLNVKYVLSLEELLESEKLVKVFEEGGTKVYENKNVYPRAFFVESVVKVDNKQQAIEKIFDESIDLRKQAIVYEEVDVGGKPLGIDEKVEIVEYRENTVKIRVSLSDNRLLILTDNYYPSWRVYIDEREDRVYQVDYNLRGVFISQGEHKIVFTARLL